MSIEMIKVPWNRFNTISHLAKFVRDCILNIEFLFIFAENNFVCDCRLKWMHGLRNETKSQNTKVSLDSVTCKMDPPIVSSAYNKMPDVIENKKDYNQQILHAGITIETLNEKMNVTEKKMIPEELSKESNAITVTKKPVKRYVLKISPENLPCPRDAKTTTESPPFIVDPVIPVQNEMKIFRFHEPNLAYRLSYKSSLVLWSGCFAFFFT